MYPIVAFVGMTGSGKSTAADCLIDLNWTYIRFGQVTINKLKERGLAVNEQNEKMVRESLRIEFGMGAFATLSLPAIQEGVRSNNVVIDGLYSWTEYDILRDTFGDTLSVVAVYSSPATRYARLQNRTTDDSDTVHKMRPLSAEDARKRDYAEIENIEKGGPIAMADYTVVNEQSAGDLKSQVLAIIEEITVK